MATKTSWWTPDLVTVLVLGIAAVLVLGLAGLSVASGEKLTFTEVAQPTSIILAAVLLARGLKPGNGNGSSSGESKPSVPPSVGGAVGMLLLILAPQMMACSGAPIVPDPRPGDGIPPCTIERGVVDGLGAAVDAVDAAVPAGMPKRDEALAYARAGVVEGGAAVDACEALTSQGRSGLAAVLPWISVAMNVARGLLAILGAAGVDVPAPLTDVLHSLGLARAEAPPPIEREAPFEVAVAP